MAADGTWNLTMQTPMGDRTATLAVTTAGNTLQGTQSAEGNSADIFEGTVSGDAVSWKLNIIEPMSMSGNMTAGAFGTWPFTGERA